jgi:hypothetical protein
MKLLERGEWKVAVGETLRGCEASVPGARCAMSLGAVILEEMNQNGHYASYRFL